MEAILSLAERLGKAIADSPQATKLHQVRKSLNDDKDLSQVLRDFREQTEKVTKLQAEQKPIEVEDKHKLRDLNEKLTASEVFKHFTAAQVEYVDMMRRVNDTITRQLEETEQEREG